MLVFLLCDEWARLWIQPSSYILYVKNKYLVLGYCKWHLCGCLKDRSWNAVFIGCTFLSHILHGEDGTYRESAFCPIYPM